MEMYGCFIEPPNLKSIIRVNHIDKTAILLVMLLDNYFHLYFTVPPAPQNVKAIKINATSMQVSWSRVNFEISGYRVYFDNNVDPDNMKRWQYWDIGDYLKCTIHNLKPKTVYAVRVQAKSIDNRFGDLSEIAVTTEGESRKNYLFIFHKDLPLTVDIFYSKKKHAFQHVDE